MEQGTEMRTATIRAVLLSLGVLMPLLGNAGGALAQNAQIIVYVDAYYSGGSRSFTGDVRDLRNERFNDRISSIRVVSGFWTVCADADFAGRCESVSGDVSNLSQTGLNDRISSIRLDSGGASFSDAIILYNDPNFRGRSISLEGDAPRLGQYDFNDRASSLRIEGGTWEVCRHGDYGGRCEIVSDDIAHLRGLDLNNEISSVRLVRSETDGWDTWWGQSRSERWQDWSEGMNSRADIFEHSDYRGSHREFDGPVPNLGQYGFNDRVSSFRVAGRWQFCEHADYGGECQVFHFDEPSLGPLGWNDRISSMRPIGFRGQGDGALVLFEDADFSGDRERIRNDEPDLGELGFNDVASSLRVHQGRWEVCEHAGYSGRCRVFNGNAGDLSSAGLNDRISSVRRLDVYEDHPDDLYGITIYEHGGYQGRSRTFEDNVANLGSQGFNDMLSSFRIHEGRWELCEHANYAGRCWTVTRDEPSVSTYGFNDKISSLRRVDDWDDTGSFGGSDGWGAAQIEVFEYTDYGGQSRVFTGNVSNLANEGWNDAVSSFRINGPGRWELCVDAAYGGRCQMFDADEPTLIPLNWNDRISSIRYFP